jgi:predicted amidohydrolase YtcJ
MTDLILSNAHVITMDPAHPSAELIAVERGRISFVGDNGNLGALKRPGTRIIDCDGKTLIPGFVDGHCHVQAFAESLVSLDLSPRAKVSSIQDIQDRIRDCSSKLPAGHWIRGKSYNEFYLAEKRHPNRWDLDAAAPFHPVKLTHRSGHAHVLSSLALELAGIGEETGDPPEGLIDRDPNTGLPTGILLGFGGYLAGKIPPLDSIEMERGVASASQKLLSYGVTSVQDASFANGPEQWRRFEHWKTLGIFRPRITMMTGFNTFSRGAHKSCFTPLNPSDLRLGSVKVIADEVTGSLRPSQEELNEEVAAIHAAGSQVAIHAIEETVIEAAANAIEFSLRKIPRQDHRHRIEHCSICPPNLLRRLAGLGVAIVTQPSFIYCSGDRYLETVPRDQQEHLYPFGAMLEHGLLVGAGSDSPIVDPNPWVSIYAAVTRRSESGSALAQQRTRVFDAIRMHTAMAAAAGFEEGIKGSLSPGKFADIVMLSENPLAVDAEQLKDVQVMMTVLGGSIFPDF